MATLFRCDNCGATSGPPPGAVNPRIWCRRCGMLMEAVELEPPKRCAVCNIETFPGRRVKDSRGQFYCDDCIAVLAKTNPLFAEAAKRKRLPAHSGPRRLSVANDQSSPSDSRDGLASDSARSAREPVETSIQPDAALALPPPEELPYQCHICQQRFAIDHVYSEPDGHVICKGCWSERRAAKAADEPAAQSATAPNDGSDQAPPGSTHHVLSHTSSAELRKASVVTPTGLPSDLSLVDEPAPLPSASASDAALPAGLELVTHHTEADGTDPGERRFLYVTPPPTRAADSSPPPVELAAPPRSAGQVELFCERCNRVYSKRQLRFAEGKQVICKSCLKRERHVEKLKARRAAEEERARNRKRGSAINLAGRVGGRSRGWQFIIGGAVLIIGGAAGVIVDRFSHTTQGAIAAGIIFVAIGLVILGST